MDKKLPKKSNRGRKKIHFTEEQLLEAERLAGLDFQKSLCAKPFLDVLLARCKDAKKNLQILNSI
jgi:hypothetical protein